MQEESGAGDSGWAGAALVGAVAGPVLQLQQQALAGWPVYAACVGTGVLMVGWAGTTRHWRISRWALALVGAALLSFGATGWRASAYVAHALDSALEGRDVQVTGVVAAMPQRNELGLRLRFEVESARVDDQPVQVPPVLQLAWYGGAGPVADMQVEAQGLPSELRPGERWRMTVRLKAPHGNLNPHGFDYELWLWEQGVQATGYVRAGARDVQPQRLGATWAHPVEQARSAVRDAIYARVEDKRAAGILAALVVGDQSAIERADWDVFRATGVAHLMSISGLHITMFAWVAALVVGALWRRSTRLCLAWPAQHAGLLGGVLLALAYSLFSGWDVPAQRTVWMLATTALLRWSGRQWPWPWVWLLACAVVVTIDPWSLTQAGFWLSFVAVGVLFASDPGGGRDEAPVGWRGRALGLLREQGVVTVALTPLTLLLFGQVSVIGLLANLVAIPWVTLVVTPLALAGVFLAPIWQAAAWAVQGLAWGLQALAALPFATFTVPAAPLWAGVAGVAGGVLLAMRLPLPLRALGVPLMLPVLLWQPQRPAAGEFELLAADIGQGNAVLVRTATHTLVYDAGPRYSAESDAGHRVLVPLLRAFGERVDTLVLSHRDSDHTGGGVAVLAMQPQAALLSSIEPGHELQRVRPATRCEAGQSWQWDGVRFEVLHPLPTGYEGTPKPNSISCVLRVANGRRTALLVGDIEQPQEARLVAEAAPSLAADVLLVPHHGSKTSSSPAFLDAVHPAVAFVQAGYRNRFGHPAAPVVARYDERRIRLVESVRCGAATWSSADAAVVACERDRVHRYWHHFLH